MFSIFIEIHKFGNTPCLYSAPFKMLDSTGNLVSSKEEKGLNGRSLFRKVKRKDWIKTMAKLN